MKLSHLVAPVALVLGITACAAGTVEEENENVESTSQAICLNWPNCTKKIGSGTFVGTTSGGMMALPEDPPTFECTGKQALCLDPNNYYLSCDATRTECVCMKGCGGGGWPYGTWNPCPSWAPRYTCNAYGSCRCY